MAHGFAGKIVGFSPFVGLVLLHTLLLADGMSGVEAGLCLNVLVVALVFIDEMVEVVLSVHVKAVGAVLFLRVVMAVSLILGTDCPFQSPAVIFAHYQKHLMAVVASFFPFLVAVVASFFHCFHKLRQFLLCTHVADARKIDFRLIFEEVSTLVEAGLSLWLSLSLELPHVLLIVHKREVVFEGLWGRRMEWVELVFVRIPFPLLFFRRLAALEHSYLLLVRLDCQAVD
jgi:hypothetical protein